MSQCTICQHAQRSIIDAELAAGLKANVIAARYRIRKVLIEHHAEHLEDRQLGGHASIDTRARDDALLAPLGTRSAFTHASRLSKDVKHLQDQVLRAQEVLVTENPLSQFKQAWQLAKDDARMQAQMIQWLNEQLRSDDMGLP